MFKKLLIALLVAAGLCFVGTVQAHAGWVFNYYYQQWVYYR